jgi:hypothetical protein
VPFQRVEASYCSFRKYSSSSVIRSTKMGWAGHVTRMGKVNIVQKFKKIVFWDVEHIVL